MLFDLYYLKLIKLLRVSLYINKKNTLVSLIIMKIVIFT